VIDTQTRKIVDDTAQRDYVLNEAWASGLCYSDLDGFALMQDGSLVLLDECGHFVYVPDGKFSIIFEG
jgi:hypothetical protein